MTTAAAPRFATELVGSWCKPPGCPTTTSSTATRAPGGGSSPSAPTLCDDAVRLAVSDQRLGRPHVRTDGEQRRQTFTGHFYTGSAASTPTSRARRPNFTNDVDDYLTMKARAATSDGDGSPRPRRTFEQPMGHGPFTWEQPILGGDVAFLRASTDRLTKVTVIGPVTLALRLVDEHYGSLRDLALALAEGAQPGGPGARGHGRRPDPAR